VTTNKRNLICPICWLRFSPDEIMHIATHPELVGDPVLGEDAPQRFLATSIDESNRALDSKGMPCTDIACPHCRCELPMEFPDTSSRIVSIVGDTAAGMSTYLAVLAKILPATLFRELNVVMQDAHPNNRNDRLNGLKNTLFNAKSPGEALICKTELEGQMYQRVIRLERVVYLPVPFIYSLANLHSKKRELLVFYDNTGLHFQPHININVQPGANHIAVAAGTIFLFDPFQSLEFRALMKESSDDQLNWEMGDNQDVILAETKRRVNKLNAIKIGEKPNTPLAVVLGKCDGWEHALINYLLEKGIIQTGEPPLRTDLFVDGCLNRQALEENSGYLRQFLFDNCPTLVANAEAFSSNVKYFAASSFGHVPMTVQTSTGFTTAPDPAKLKPFQVEIPPLWILSEVSPGLIACR
jgi:hypothetical protein